MQSETRITHPSIIQNLSEHFQDWNEEGEVSYWRHVHVETQADKQVKDLIRVAVIVAGKDYPVVVGDYKIGDEVTVEDIDAVTDDPNTVFKRELARWFTDCLAQYYQPKNYNESDYLTIYPVSGYYASDTGDPEFFMEKAARNVATLRGSPWKHPLPDLPEGTIYNGGMRWKIAYDLVTRPTLPGEIEELPQS